MTESTRDGFCPRCFALEDQTCQRPDGSPCPDHKARRPYPTRTPSCVEERDAMARAIASGLIDP